MPKLLTPSLLIYFIIANILFLLSNIPLFINISRTPPGSRFPLYHSNAPQDYNAYLSVITLGENGYWLNRDSFTSEQTKPGIFYFYYIIVGKIGGIFNLWPPVAYHLARIVSVELFLITTYLCCTAFLGKKAGFWAGVLALMATIAPPFLFGEKEAFITYAPWWADSDTLKRLDALPHHIFGQALLLFSIIFILAYIRKKQPKCFILTIISVFISGIILPPSVIPILFGLPLAWIIHSIQKIKSVSHISLLTSHFSLRISNLKYILIPLSATLPLLLSFWQTRQGFPWTQWIEWEKAMWNQKVTNFNQSLFLSFGILPVLAIPAAVRSFRHKESFEQVYLTVWAFLPFLILPFVDILGIGKIRLISGAPFVPFALLSAKTIIYTKKVFLRIFLVFLLVASSIPTTIYLLQTRIIQAGSSTIYANIFIPDSVWNTINFINTHVPKDSVILSNEFIGNIFPAYTTARSYFGHLILTKDFFEKQKNVALFYSQKFTEIEAKAFLLENQVTYVYYGPEERMANILLSYDLLKPIYSNGDITFFQVTQ